QFITPLILLLLGHLNLFTYLHPPTPNKLRGAAQEFYKTRGLIKPSTRTHPPLLPAVQRGRRRPIRPRRPPHAPILLRAPRA
uniref:Uncharacterized protein n=1 Tax=Aegilops tauschii subsp. strangulata TaxID=200361 RepID=A0A453H5W0_AEGTS